MKFRILSILLIALLSCNEHEKSISFVCKPGSQLPDLPDTISTTTFNQIESFLQSNKSFNSKTAFLVDMKRPSGEFRFFILDVSNKKVIDKGLVAQGINTKQDSNGHLTFSNELNSGCTSLGKYKVGEKYMGRFGPSYKLYGLEKTNSNAYRRYIVLHGYKAVPDSQQDRNICYSLGCPMVSPLFLTRIEDAVDRSDKPILLDIIY